VKAGPSKSPTLQKGADAAGKSRFQPADPAGRFSEKRVSRAGAMSIFWSKISADPRMGFALPDPRPAGQKRPPEIAAASLQPSAASGKNESFSRFA
jgi:hypothetical protein